MSNLNGYLMWRRPILDHLKDGRLTHNEFLAFNILATLADAGTGGDTINAPILGCWLGGGLHQNTVQRILRSLHEKGYIWYRGVKNTKHAQPYFIDKYLLTKGFMRTRITNLSQLHDREAISAADVLRLADQAGDQAGDQVVDQPLDDYKKEKEKEKIAAAAPDLPLPLETGKQEPVIPQPTITFDPNKNKPVAAKAKPKLTPEQEDALWYHELLCGLDVKSRTWEKSTALTVWPELIGRLRKNIPQDRFRAILTWASENGYANILPRFKSKDPNNDAARWLVDNWQEIEDKFNRKDGASKPSGKHEVPADIKFPWREEEAVDA